MRVAIHYILITLGLSLITACNPQPEARKLLAEAVQWMEDHPDSALIRIDSIFFPEKSLNRAEYMQYLVTKVQAKYKTYRDISADTLIFNARDYFLDHNKDPKKTALAFFYSGCVYREQEDYKQTMLHYKKAGSYAAKSEDIGLQGLIEYNTGDLFSIQGMYRQALESYKTAEALYHGMPEKQTQCLSAMGRMYTLLQLPDSAFFYFHKGLELAQASKDEKLLSLLAQNLSVAYKEVKQYDKAETYLRQSFLINRDSTELSRYYLNFAELYFCMGGQQDSAIWYTELLKQHIDSLKDNYFKASAYLYLAEWEKMHSNYGKAFFYQEKRMKAFSRIMKERKNQSIYEIQQKYDYEQLQKQYYKNISVRQQWIITLLVMVITGGTVFTLYWIRQKNRKAETQRNIDTLKEMNRNLEVAVHQKNLDLRKDLLWRFDITKKVVKINGEIARSDKQNPEKSAWIKQFNKIVYGDKSVKEQWEAMLQAFNMARPGFSEKIRKKYPTLSDAEFKVCILTYAGFRVREIALILNQSSNTIQVRRTKLRKKMGIESGSDIATHLDETLG